MIGAIADITDESIDKRTSVGNAGSTQSEVDDPEVNKALQAGKLVVRDSGNVIILGIETIDWVDAAGDYMCIHSAGETHVVRKTMKDLLAELDQTIFKRIHRSTVVNLKRIVRIEPLPKGERTVYLDNGETLKVSRNYRQALDGLVS